MLGGLLRCACLAGRLQRAGPLAQGRAVGRGVGRRVRSKLGPINGDFEMVQMATADRRLRVSCPIARRAAATSWSTPSPAGCRARAQRLHRCLLGPRLRRHDGRCSPPAWSSARSSTIAAARPRCCCRSSSGRRSRSRTALLFLLRCVALATAVRLVAGAAMSGLAIAVIGFGADAAADRAAHAGGPGDAGGGLRRLHPSVELAGVLRLHEDQPLLPVRQLHALGHSAVHPDGRVRRALRHVHRACSRPPRPSRAACAAAWPWR